MGSLKTEYSAPSPDHKGLFITFEGGEGSGKTTQIKMLSCRLREEGFEPVLAREPGGTVTGEAIRRLLLDPASSHIRPCAELFLYAADRNQHVEEVIMPALNDGRVVICDRFTDSSMAYQGFGRGICLDFIERLMDLATGGLKPDLTLILDVEPSHGKSRVASRAGEYGSSGDRFERAPMAFHDRIREGYLELARRNADRIRLISAGSYDEVAARIWQQVEPGLRKMSSPTSGKRGCSDE